MVIRYILCSLLFFCFAFSILLVSLNLADSLPVSVLQLELLLHTFRLQDRRGETQGLYECVLCTENFISSSGCL